MRRSGRQKDQRAAGLSAGRMRPILSVPCQSLSHCRDAAGQQCRHMPAQAMEFVRIPPGEFMMGCSASDNECDDDEKPAHRVRITKAFEMGKYEVTQAQWESVMERNPSSFKGADRPVEQVSWNDVQQFLQKLNAKQD